MLIPDLLAACMCVCVCSCASQPTFIFIFFLASQPPLLSLSIMSRCKQGLFGVVCECVHAQFGAPLKPRDSLDGGMGSRALREGERRMRGGGKEIVVCCLAFQRSFMI